MEVGGLLSDRRQASGRPHRIPGADVARVATAYQVVEQV
jgi:hypothetical protein